MRRVHKAVWVAWAAAVAGCASPRFAGVSPDQIPALEAQRATRGNDPAVLASLGEAYYAAGRFAEADTALKASVGIDPSNMTASLYLAFTLDTLGDYAGARDRYEAVRGSQLGGDIAHAVDDRVALLSRKETVARAKMALANEASLSAQAPLENTVAVLPLRYSGADTSLAPLGRGLAEVMVTDFGAVSRLKLVERAQIQALLDELALAGSGRADSATAARSGRLLRASRVVDGTISDAPDSALRIDASVVDATSAVAVASSASDKLAQLFDIEKTVVLDMLRQMGITLSPAEQAKIAERPTKNVLAFLAYSRGLQAADHGDFGGATRSFTEARQIDPAFGAAFIAAQNAARLSQAAATKPADLSPRLASADLLQNRARLRSSIAHVAPGAGDFADRLGNDAGRTGDRKSIQESTNSQGPAAAVAGTTIIITVKRP